MIAHGWTETLGGKHVIKMEKPGRRPITHMTRVAVVIPPACGPRFSERQAWPVMDEVILDDTPEDVSTLGSRYHVTVHQERADFWAEVDELPGCFASGRDLAELKEAVLEAIELYTSTRTRRNHVDRATWRRTGEGRFSITLATRPAASGPLLPGIRLRSQATERRKATA